MLSMVYNIYIVEKFPTGSSIYSVFNIEEECISRDLKPENILIAQDNRAKLSDFGMARVLATIQHNTAGSGTPVRIEKKIIYFSSISSIFY